MIALETADTPVRNGAGWDVLVWHRPPSTATRPSAAASEQHAVDEVPAAAARRELQEMVRQARRELHGMATQLEQLTQAAERAEAAVARRTSDPARVGLERSLAAWLEEQRQALEAELAAARAASSHRLVTAPRVVPIPVPSAPRPAVSHGRSILAAGPWVRAGLPAPFSAGSRRVPAAFS